MPAEKIDTIALSLEALSEDDLELIADWFVYGLTHLLKREDALFSYRIEFANIKTKVYPDAIMGSINGEKAFFFKGQIFSNNEYRVNLLLQPQIRDSLDLIVLIWKFILTNLPDRLGQATITTEFSAGEKIEIEALEQLGFLLKEVTKGLRGAKFIYFKKN